MSLLVIPNTQAINLLLTLIKPILEDPNSHKITHNGKFEYSIFQNYDITLRGISFDTILAAYLLYPGEKIGLKDLALSKLGIEMTSYEALTQKNKIDLVLDGFDNKLNLDFYENE